MKYKVLAVDVDGTLENTQNRTITPQVYQAIQQLRQQGVLVVIATGRGAFATTPGVLGGLQVDYRVCANGACVLDHQNEILFERRMDLDHIKLLQQEANDTGHILTFSFEDAYYVYSGYPKLLEWYNEGVPGAILNGETNDRHHQSMPFCGFLFMQPEEAESYRFELPGLKMMHSMPGMFDVCHDDMDKQTGLSSLLQKLGIGWEHVVAIGDSENDIGMLRAAGLGVAMGNAAEHVKQNADKTTESVLDDGVAKAIERYFS